jgi:hypothetical protein
VHVAIAVHLAVIFMNPTRSDYPEVSPGQESAPGVMNPLLRLDFDLGGEVQCSKHGLPWRLASGVQQWNGASQLRGATPSLARRGRELVYGAAAQAESRVAKNDQVQQAQIARRREKRFNRRCDQQTAYFLGVNPSRMPSHEKAATLRVRSIGWHSDEDRLRYPRRSPPTS